MAVWRHFEELEMASWRDLTAWEVWESFCGEDTSTLQYCQHPRRHINTPYIYDPDPWKKAKPNIGLPCNQCPNVYYEAMYQKRGGGGRMAVIARIVLDHSWHNGRRDYHSCSSHVASTACSCSSSHAACSASFAVSSVMTACERTYSVPQRNTRPDALSSGGLLANHGPTIPIFAHVNMARDINQNSINWPTVPRSFSRVP